MMHNHQYQLQQHHDHDAHGSMTTNISHNNIAILILAIIGPHPVVHYCTLVCSFPTFCLVLYLILIDR